MYLVLAIIGVGLVISFTICYVIWADRKRTEGLQYVATELGLEFFPDGSKQLQAELGRFNLFKRGRGKKLAKLIQGASDDVSISIFDYRFTTGSGKQSRTYNQSVAALSSQKLTIPDFTMRPEGLLDRLGGMIGFANIDFDTHPKFSSLYVLKGSSEEKVRQFFKPELLSYFEQRKVVNVEAAFGMIIIFAPGRNIAPSDIKEFLSLAYEVYGAIVDSL